MKMRWNKGGDRHKHKSVFTAIGDCAECVPVNGSQEQPHARNQPRPGRQDNAFTLVEVMIGTVVTTLMLVSLYTGFTFGFRELQLARQEARATQILEEKMELIRLLTWDQVANLPGYIPTTFTESFYATNPTNSSGGLSYTGTVVVTNAPITESYKADLRMVQVTVNWSSGKNTYKRSMSGFVSQYGMQKYVY